MKKHELGRIAYEEFRKRDVGAGLPEFNELPIYEREAWDKSAEAVKKCLEDLGINKGE
jgi:hypothetical protein